MKSKLSETSSGLGIVSGALRPNSPFSTPSGPRCQAPHFIGAETGVRWELVALLAHGANRVTQGSTSLTVPGLGPRPGTQSVLSA